MSCLFIYQCPGLLRQSEHQVNSYMALTFTVLTQDSGLWKSRPLMLLETLLLHLDCMPGVSLSMRV